MDDFSNFRALAPDLERLLAYSVPLRGHIAMIRRNPSLAQSWKGHAAFQRFVNNVRLDMRVEVDAAPPHSDREALQYMQRPYFVASKHHEWLQGRNDRSHTDKRVLRTIDRLIGDAAAVDVPLWPSQLAASHHEQATWFVKGETEQKPGEDGFHLGLCVQIGHGVHRQLPWRCWSILDGMVERAGVATGYPLRAYAAAPGEYELVPECRPYDANDDPARPYRPKREESREEAERLFAFYSGAEWIYPEGDADV